MTKDSGRQTKKRVAVGRRRFALLSLLLIFCTLSCTKENRVEKEADPLFVLSGAGLKCVLDPLAEEFTKETGIEVEYSYLCSAMLLTNLELTHQGDVFVAGAKYYFNLARDKGLVDEEHMIIAGYQVPCIMVQEGNPKNIQSLDDFKRDEVKKAFDKNNDGKADLTACPPGWGCETVIAHHMDVYDLDAHINPVKAAYEAGMASTLAEYKSGEPIFFYTWAPNWTIFKLKPGKDVVWINVPKIIPKESQKVAADKMTVSGIEGAVSDPIKLGFVVSDIQIVANKKFTSENPAAQKFFEVFTLPLGDINEQNTRMNAGEKSAKDIARHVDEWIAKNSDKWNGWLTAARAAAK